MAAAVVVAAVVAAPGRVGSVDVWLDIVMSYCSA